MEHNEWKRENLDEWIENKRLLELTVQLPDETFIFQGRILDYNLGQDEVTVYNELQNELTKIKLGNIDCINDEVDRFIDSDHLD